MTVSIPLVAIIAAAGYATYAHNGYASRVPEAIRTFTSVSFDPEKDWRLHNCYLYAEENAFNTDACIDKGKASLVFLWGDSHAAALYPGLRTLQRESGFRLAQRSRVRSAPFCRAATHPAFLRWPAQRLDGQWL